MCSLVPQLCELLAKATADRAAELRLHTGLAYGLIVYGLSLIFSHFFISAPYGRYASSNWGPKVPAKLGAPHPAMSALMSQAGSSKSRRPSSSQCTYGSLRPIHRLLATLCIASYS